jgi:2-succinyl-6-hydroxy-2,4-cyclohexadiene-1-carboxylate synthase
MTPVNADRIVLVHGFTQTAASWRPTVARLTAGLGPDVDIVALDAPGHGDRSDVRADLPTGAAMLGDDGGHATYIGYSMGGRLCLHLALASPHLVDRLVLIGTTPGIEDDRERDARRAADDELADEIERIGVGVFVERWLSQPLFARLGRSDGDVETRLTNTSAGLASSLRLAGTGTQAPLWARLGELTMPVLVVAGEHDAKFAAIGRRMADAIPDASFAVIEGAGHAAHLERPAQTCATIMEWLRARQPPSASPSAKSAP